MIITLLNIIVSVAISQPHTVSQFVHLVFYLLFIQISAFFHLTCDDTSILSMYVILQRYEECNGECIKDDNQACNQIIFVCDVCMFNCLLLSFIYSVRQCIYPSVYNFQRQTQPKLK